MYRYRAWDGTQPIEALPPENVLRELSDPLLDGNVEQALDRALHRGMSVDGDDALAGIDRLRDQLRAARMALNDDIESNPDLQELASRLAAAASDDGGPDSVTTELLAALAARPDASRVLGSLPAPQRELVGEALTQFADSAFDSNVSPPGGEDEFSGWLDAVNDQINAIDELEQRLRKVRRVEDAVEIDPALIRAVLGAAAAEQFQRLVASLQQFVDSGLIRISGQPQRLSARALQLIGDDLLALAAQRIASRESGDRRDIRQGQHELTGASRDYQFGDPLALDLSRTVMQAIRRRAGVPVTLAVDDFTIFEKESTVRAATVLALDLSRSMGERGYLLAAKKLALALMTLVRTRYPRDEFRLIGFSDTARSIAPHELPQLTWDRFGFGTNVQDSLRLARSVLATHRGMQRNIILLTDGEPTAHRDLTGQAHFHHPTSPETLSFTYAEADRVRRDGIDLCVCVLSSSMQVVRFAEELARTAAGNLVITPPENLSEAVITQYGKSRPR